MKTLPISRMKKAVRTVARDARTGAVLATFPDDLKQVKVGGDFYIGQVRHVVVRIVPGLVGRSIYVARS